MPITLRSIRSYMMRDFLLAQIYVEMNTSIDVAQPAVQLLIVRMVGEGGGSHMVMFHTVPHHYSNTAACINV
jgi:hypothetical protein